MLWIHLSGVLFQMFPFGNTTLRQIMKMWNDTAHIHASQEIADFPSTVRFPLVPKTPSTQFHSGHRTSVTCCKPQNLQTFIPVIVTGAQVITTCLRTDRHISRPYLELSNPPTHRTFSPPCYFDYECFPGKVFSLPGSSIFPDDTSRMERGCSFGHLTGTSSTHPLSPPAGFRM
jgi:hypothetical protein